MTTSNPTNLADFFLALDRRTRLAIEGAPFHPTQRELLLETAARLERTAAQNPLADPLSLFYLVATANGRAIDEQGEELGSYLRLLVLSLGLFDDVQDDDLASTPHAEAGMPIAVNSALSLLSLAFDALRRGMDLESNVESRSQYLETFTRTALVACGGQHRDLLGETATRTPAEVLAMQEAKTSSGSMICETAAIFAHAGHEGRARYRRIGASLSRLVQVVDDVRDVYGKRLSPDLATGKMTYPLACFLESATPAERAELERLVVELPSSIRTIRKLWYEAGVIHRVAAQVEEFRRAIHADVAATQNASPAHRTLLFLVDGVARMIYPTPEVSETRAVLEPICGWHGRVRDLAQVFTTNMRSHGVPPLPALAPWHLPQWIYHPDTATVYYPDIEGQPEETLGLEARLLGTTDFGLVREVADAHAPTVVAHELFHYWRDRSGRITHDLWHEEFVANTLALAYSKVYEPLAFARVLELTARVLSRPENRLDPPALELLESILSSDGRGARGYGVSLFQMAIVQIAMVSRLAKELPPLEQAVAQYLGRLAA